jgi:PHD/YefM family antitoxin component YafN of YafNO toxin-antitoxin module
LEDILNKGRCLTMTQHPHHVSAYIDEDLFERMEIQRKKRPQMTISSFAGEAIKEKVERMEREDHERAEGQRERFRKRSATGG